MAVPCVLCDGMDTKEAEYWFETNYCKLCSNTGFHRLVTDKFVDYLVHTVNVEHETKYVLNATRVSVIMRLATDSYPFHLEYGFTMDYPSNLFNVGISPQNLIEKTKHMAVHSLLTSEDTQVYAPVRQAILNVFGGYVEKMKGAGAVGKYSFGKTPGEAKALAAQNPEFQAMQAAAASKDYLAFVQSKQKIQSFAPPAYEPTGSQITGSLNSVVPGMAHVTRCPACVESFREQVGQGLFPQPPQEMTVERLIPHLNDTPHKWTREQIADWIETLDADFTFKTAPAASTPDKNPCAEVEVPPTPPKSAQFSPGELADWEKELLNAASEMTMIGEPKQGKKTIQVSKEFLADTAELNKHFDAAVNAAWKNIFDSLKKGGEI